MESTTRHLLRGKIALVTGGSRGIGRAIAQRLAADGALVGVHYGGNEAAANETLKAIEQTGGQAFLVKAELGMNGDIDMLFTKLEKELSGRPLDILVNNAAIAPQIAIAQTTPKEFDRIFAINVRAPFFIIQRALPLMPDGARIVNISSGVTWFATPATVYSMTKGALNVLSRSLANSLGDRNITVNTISPGITDTDMNPSVRDKDPKAVDRVAAMTALGRPGRADDIADAVAFFASNDARWITGQTLDVNGGLFLGPRES
jgi:NAD(P)-dependent dehydrogenase (short-subunit alcohol dehydrogenase family)